MVLYIKSVYKELNMDNEHLALGIGAIKTLKTAMQEVIIGQETLIDAVIMAFLAHGHLLIEGVPGLAKTLTVKAFAGCTGLSFSRIQFTPDLLPGDITGTMIFEQGKGCFIPHKGPIFAQVLLADEINRAPAKVQSALLEGMEELQVTFGGETYPLPDPFFVLATQNPLEHEGVFRLPEAQLDRFMMKILIQYPTQTEEHEIAKQYSAVTYTPVSQIKKVIAAQELHTLRTILDAVQISHELIDYIIRIVSVLRKKPDQSLPVTVQQEILRGINYGPGPRAVLALHRAARASALIDGREHVSPDDIKRCAPAVLRHRLLLSYEAEAQGIVSDDIIALTLKSVPLP